MTVAMQKNSRAQLKKASGKAALRVVALVLFAQSSSAQDNALAYAAGAERIDLAGQIQARTQEIAVLNCLITAGIMVEENRKSMKDAVGSVDSLLNALSMGDISYNVELAESSQTALSSIQRVRIQWDPFKKAAEEVSLGANPADGQRYIEKHNLNILHGTKLLESQIIAEYAIPPALLQSDAFTLHITMRQRALMQQIKKEACGVMSGNRILGTRQRLDRAVSLFDKSFIALREGYPSAGVSTPPNSTIAKKLDDMVSDWAAANALLKDLGQGASSQEVERLEAMLDAVYQKMVEIAPLYVVAIRERN
jgi:hypothetical protein